SLRGAELPERDPPGAALEDQRQRQDGVVDGGMRDRQGRPDVAHPLEDGRSGAESEDNERHDEAPEVELTAVTERVVRVRGLRRAPETIEKQQLVPGVDERMHRLA